MRLAHLSLTSFRNYSRLEFDLPPKMAVFQGANAQGKTNLLEAVCFLSTTRFSHPVSEREILHWNTLEDPKPFAKVSASVSRGEERPVHLDVLLRPRAAQGSDPDATVMPVQKLVRVNGVPRRVADMVGQLMMVMFSPRDMDLISDEPSLRRRYLDITNSQIDRQYLKALQRYGRVVTRRNHLLKQIASRQSRPDELVFWDQELVATGSYIVVRREKTLAELNRLADPIHRQLSGSKETLKLQYRRSISPGSAGPFSSVDEAAQAFREALKDAHEKELARGVSLVGPHRDDIVFWADEVDMGPYGSRGQQRTVVLALKLAEVRLMQEETAQTPVLLLDDVLSELDADRREHLLETVSSYEQVLITTTDTDRFPPEFLAQAQQFTVQNGTIL